MYRYTSKNLKGDGWNDLHEKQNRKVRMVRAVENQIAQDLGKEKDMYRYNRKARGVRAGFKGSRDDVVAYLIDHAKEEAEIVTLMLKGHADPPGEWSEEDLWDFMAIKDIPEGYSK